MAIRDLIVRISAQSSDFERGIANAQRGLQSFATKAGELGNTLSLNLTAPIAALAGFSLRAAADMDSLKRGLTAVTGSATAAEAQMVKLKKVAELPGLGFKEAVQGAINLQAAGFSADLAERSLRAFGNALATVGRGRADLEGVNVVLGQIVNKPSLMAQDLNQLRERLPQITQLMQDAFGTRTSEGIQALGLTGKQFVQGLITQMEKLPQVTGGIANSFENLKDRAQQSLAKIGEIFVPTAIRIIDTLDPMLVKVAELAAEFTKLPDTVKQGTIALAAFAAVSGPLLKLLEVLSKLGIAMAFLAKSLPAIGAGVAALVGFVGAPIVVLSGALTFLILQIEKLKEELEEAKTSIKGWATIATPIAPIPVPVFTAPLRGQDKEINDFQKRYSASLTAIAADSALAAAGVDKFAASNAKTGPPVMDAAAGVNALAASLSGITPKAVSLVETFRRLDETLREQAGFKQAEADMLSMLNALANDAAFSRMEEVSGDLTRSIDGLSEALPVAETAFRNLSVEMQNSINRGSEALEFFERQKELIDRSLAPGRVGPQPSEVFSPEGNKALQDALKNVPALEAATKRGEEQFKRTSAAAQFFGRQVSTAISDTAKGITDVIAGAKGLGETFRSIAHEISKSILRFIVEQGLNVALSQVGRLIGRFADLGGAFSSLFGTAASVAGTAASAGAQVAGGVASTAGGIASAAGQGASAAISAALPGLMGPIGLGLSAVNAVFTGLQYFQQRRMEQDIGRIEVTSRSIYNTLTGIYSTMRETLLAIPEIKGYLFGTQIVALNNISAALEGGVRGGAGGPISITVNASSNSARDIAQSIIRELRLLDPRFA